MCASSSLQVHTAEGSRFANAARLIMNCAWVAAIHSMRRWRYRALCFQDTSEPYRIVLCIPTLKTPDRYRLVIDHVVVVLSLSCKSRKCL